jgi:nicotinamidase-related amidase
MNIDVRTPANTAIVLIDYVVGFANSIGSQTLAENTAGAVALAKTAKLFDVPLVVTLRPVGDPRGGLYPALAGELGDHPLVHRRGSFDSFIEEEFAEAIDATGRRHLVVAGIMSEGCVVHTALGAMRRNYEVSIVVDATGGETPTTHDAAVSRLLRAGATPTTWLSLASEFQTTYEHADTVDGFRAIQRLSPTYAMLQSTIATAVAAGRAAASGS